METCKGVFIYGATFSANMLCGAHVQRLWNWRGKLNEVKISGLAGGSGGQKRLWRRPMRLTGSELVSIGRGKRNGVKMYGHGKIFE